MNFSSVVVPQSSLKAAPAVLALALAFAASTADVQAAAITWQTPVTIAGDADVSTAGTLKYAYNCSGSTSTVNGVSFTANTSPTFTADGNISFTFSNNWNGFGSASTPYSSLSASYKTLLGNANFRDASGGSAVVTITLNNLVPGRSYAVQLWVNDSRSSTRTETLTSSGGNTVSLAFSVPQSAGGIGQYSLGTFTADATTQSFTVTSTGSAQMNAIQVRDLTVTKAPTGTDLAASASWVEGVAPVSTNIATWTSTSLGAGLTIGSSVSWLGISAPNAASDITITGSGTLTLGASGIDMSAAAKNVSIANPIALGSSQTWTVNSGRTLTASGNVSGQSDRTLTKGGAGTLILPGTNTYSGSTFVKSGTVVVSGSGSVNASSFNSVGASAGDNGTLTLTNTGSFTTASDMNVGDNGATASPAVGTMNIFGTATLTASSLILGSAYSGANSGATGTINQSGGTVTTSRGGDAGVIVGGRNSGSTLGIGTYNLSGGTVNVNNGGNVWVGGYGKGTNNQTGGEFNTTSWTALGRQGGSFGVWNISGGRLTHSNSNARINVGEAGTGTLNISGSAYVITTGGMLIAVNSSGVGTVNLNGGTNSTPIIQKGEGAATYNFNGGTLQAMASSTTFMQGLTTANVQNGGAIIDCQGNNITIAQPLLNGGTGGLTKLGTGTLILSGASTYTGPTIAAINSGVQVPANGSAGALVLSNTISSTNLRIGNYAANTNVSGHAAVQLGFDNALPATSMITFDGKNGGPHAYLKLMGKKLTVAGLIAVANDNLGNTSALIVNDGGDAGTAGQVGVITISNSTAVTYPGRIRDNTGTGSGTGGIALVKDGTGTLSLTGPYNTPIYTKGTTIKNGTLDISGINGTGFSANAPITNAGGIFHIGTQSLPPVSYLHLTGGGTISGTGSITNNSSPFDLQSGTVNPVLAGIVGINKSTTGTVTLSGNNTLSGPVTLSAGTLALSGSGAISNASSISIAAGATFDVSALSSTTFNLSGSTALSASGTGTAIGTSAATIKGAAAGIVNLGSRPVALTYNGSQPALYISQGTLVLGGNTFTVNSSTPLAPGSYAIIQQASGNVVNNGTFTVTGTAIAFGTTAAINVNGGIVNLIISQKPRALAIFGSSVAKGLGSSGASNTLLVSGGSYSNSWAALLTTNLLAQSYVITNLSMPGDNSQGAVTRYANTVRPQYPRFVFVSYSLGNDDLAGSAIPEGTVSTFLANLTNVVVQSFTNGTYPVIASCYARNNIQSAGRDYYLKDANLSVNTWSVPSVNFDGTLNNGNGGLISGVDSGDGIHPNDYGHAEMYYSIPPTLFEALAQGKTNRPSFASPTNYARLVQRPGVTSPIVFTPTNTVHSFTMSFRVRGTNNGTIAAIRTGTSYATLQITNGQFAYVGPGGSRILTGSINATNGAWHDLAISFRYALTNTTFFVDGNQAGSLTEQYVPDQFVLGGPAGSGAAATPATVDFQNWCVYRSAWNSSEALAQSEGKLQQGSMEIGSMLDDASFSYNKPLTNRAASLSVAVVNTDGLAAKQSLVPPSNLSIISVPGASARLTWTPNSTTESGFLIERRSSGSGPWNAVATVPAGATTYDDSGLTVGVYYDYRVAALEGALAGYYSNTATIGAGIGAHEVILVDFGPNDGTNGHITPGPDGFGQYWNNLVSTSLGGSISPPLSLPNLVTKSNSATAIGLVTSGNWSANGIQNGGLLSPSYALLGNFAVASATEDYFFTQSSASLTFTNLDPSYNYTLRLFGTRNAAKLRTSRYVAAGGNGPFTNLLQTSGATWTNHGTVYNGNNNTVAKIAGVVPDALGQIQLGVSCAGDENFAYLGILEITANRSPLAQTLAVTRTAGLSLKVALSDLVTTWSDADGDSVRLVGINLVTTNGVNLTTNSSFILYTNSANVADQISYTITDGQGGTNTGVVNISVAGIVAGQTRGIALNGNMVTANFAGIPGQSYSIERTFDLGDPTGWTVVSATNAPTAGLFEFSETFGDPPPTSAYYRLRWNP